MASNLYDILKANQEAGAGSRSRSRDFQQAVLAKSGKAPALTEGPQKSTISETAAIQAGDAAQAQIATQEQQQSLDIQRQQEGVVEQQRQTMGRLQMADDKQRTAYLRNVSNIVADTNRNMAGLSQERRNAQIEQAGFLLGLSNKKYVQELEQAANTNRLWDEAQFNQELLKTSLDDDWELFQNDLQFRELFNSSQRAFEKELTQMKMKDKYNLFKKQLKAAQMRKIFSGGTSMVSSYLSSAPATASGSTPTGGGGAGTGGYQTQSDPGYGLSLIHI